MEIVFVIGFVILIVLYFTTKEDPIEVDKDRITLGGLFTLPWMNEFSCETAGAVIVEEPDSLSSLKNSN